jgi:hypothetical protein
MRERDFASTMLGVGFCILVFAFALSPMAQEMMAARTDRQAQARTLWDVDRVGAAMFSWLTDQVGVAAAGQSEGRTPLTTETVDMNNCPVISHGDLASLLVPQYLDDLPALDGWNHSYDFRLNVANPLANQVMGIRSPGRDGSYSGSLYTVGSIDPESFDEDVVWADGFAVRWPALVLTGRAAQKKTVADIQSIGAAMFRWLTDQVGFAAPEKPRDLTAVTVNFPDYPVITHAALVSVLVPQYIHHIPELDGWEHPYDFRLNLANPLANQVMAIRSPGRDGAFSGSSYLVSPFDPNLFDEDIAWADGAFVRSPAPLSGLAFFSLSPCRVFDTRPASALQSGTTSLFEIGALCGIPTSAKAVTVNVTVAGPTGAGSVTLFPAGLLPVPDVPTIHFAAGQTRGNNAILGVTEDGIGSIEARTLVNGGGQVHLILDITGYFE